MSDIVKDVLALLPAGVCACVAFVASFAITGELWFNLAAAAAAFASMLWYLLRHSKTRLAVTAIGTVCLIAAALGPTILDRMAAKPAPVPEAVVRQIASTAIPLFSVDAGNGFSDLQPLETIWSGARVVALGEATHGTSEFFRMKFRLTEFLVARMRFHHFAMELDPELGEAVERYVQGVSGNPMERLPWPWQTREVASMLEWMRRYNESAVKPDKLHFHGIDYQGERRDFRMARNTLDLLDNIGREERVILWAHNAHVSNGAGWMGSYLKTALHNEIYLTGFEFHHGQFTSRFQWVRTYDAEPADTRFYADALSRTGLPMAFLDFRTLMNNPAVEAWLNQPHLSHDLEEAHGLLRLRPALVRDDENWPSLYDGVIYLERSTPSHSGTVPGP